MSPMVRKLSSLHLSAWILLLIMGWLAWGIWLAGSESHAHGFREMNGQLVRHWLTSKATGTSILKLWFIGLCGATVLLGVNLGFCTFSRMIKAAKIRLTGPRLFIILIHLLFGLVALGHFAGFMFGFEKNGILLSEGDTWQGPDGYEIRITGVHFRDPVQVLAKPAKDLLRDEFNYRNNTADVTISLRGSEICRNTIHILNPLRCKGMQVTLRQFVPPGAETAAGKSNPSVLCNISHHPTLDIFLILYPLMIASIAVYLAMTWRVESREKVS